MIERKGGLCASLSPVGVFLRVRLNRDSRWPCDPFVSLKRFSTCAAPALSPTENDFPRHTGASAWGPVASVIPRGVVRVNSGRTSNVHVCKLILCEGGTLQRATSSSVTARFNGDWGSLGMRQDCYWYIYTGSPLMELIWLPTLRARVIPLCGAPAESASGWSPSAEIRSEDEDSGCLNHLGASESRHRYLRAGLVIPAPKATADRVDLVSSAGSIHRRPVGHEWDTFLLI